MKANVLKISFALMALLIGLASCENSRIEKDEFLERRGGEDTDEPIIVGLGLDANEDPLYPAHVELYESGVTVLVDETFTNASGEFQFTVDSAGDYYLKLYQNQQLLITTDVFEVTDSTYIVVQL